MQGARRFMLAACVAMLGFLAQEVAADHERHFEYCNSTYAEEKTGNPLGSCACDGHLWVAPGCQEGFYCYNSQAEGCHITCTDDLILYTNFANGYWDCRPNGPPTIAPPGKSGKKVEVVSHNAPIIEGLPDTQALLMCPFGGYDVCPSDERATTPFPPDEADGNPLGECRCNGELWVSEGCSYGFYCNDTETIGGQYLYCPEGEVIHIAQRPDFTWTWECTTETETCYGGAVLGIGCEMPECEYSRNPFGPCECEGQFFINDECTEGFWCSSNIPDTYLYDGCYQKCLDGQVLHPDFVSKNWTCVDAAEQKLCPGNFKLECDATGDFDESVCDCPDGQLHVSGDCKESFYCRSRSVGGGVDIKCEEEGQIVSLNYTDWSWSCKDDEGNCPGLGGFKVGCDDSGTIEKPELDCNFGINPYGNGTCDCESQIYINKDCNKAFYCSEHIPADEDEDFNGCQLDCKDGERVHYVPEDTILECIPMDDDYICPGEFSIDCPSRGEFNPTCNCANELWMNEDCSRAYICNEEREHGIFGGFFVDCPEGEHYDVNFSDLMNVQCSTNAAVCPGSFHFGCEGGDIEDIFTPGPPSGEDTTTGGATAATSAGAIAGLSLFLVLSYLS